MYIFERVLIINNAARKVFKRVRKRNPRGVLNSRSLIRARPNEYLSVARIASQRERERWRWRESISEKTIGPAARRELCNSVWVCDNNMAGG
jgi:hypothetical protein